MAILLQLVERQDGWALVDDRCREELFPDRITALRAAAERLRLDRPTTLPLHAEDAGLAGLHLLH